MTGVACRSVHATRCASRTMPILGIIPGTEKPIAGEEIVFQWTQRQSIAQKDVAATSVVPSDGACGRPRSCAQRSGTFCPGQSEISSVTASMGDHSLAVMECSGGSPPAPSSLARGSGVQGAVLFPLFHVSRCIAYSQWLLRKSLYLLC